METKSTKWLIFLNLIFIMDVFKKWETLTMFKPKAASMNTIH